MKGYQLKAAIKNQKPPVWRRCIVPAGITYSQLSLILTEIMERKEDGDFEFEFYGKKIRFGERDEGKEIRKDYSYSTAEASEFYIDELLDTEDWFSFYYHTYQKTPEGFCFQNDLKLRVTIEKEVRWDRAFYPVILKAADVAVGEPDSREEHRLDLSKRVAQVNEELKKKYMVQYKEPEYKTRAQIQKEHREGNFGLAAWEKADNEGKKISHSAMYQIKLIADVLAGKLTEEEKQYILSIKKERESQESSQRQPEESEEEGRISLKELLKWNSKEDLLNQGRAFGLFVNSSMNKDKLAEMTAEKMLTPEVMRKYFIKLDDEKIQAWEEAVEIGGYHEPKEEQKEILEQFYEDNYLAMYDGGFVEIPPEVAKGYREINTPEFQERRRQVSWLIDCLYIHAMLYGVSPASVVMRMYRKRQGYRLQQKDFAGLFKDIPEEYNPCVLREDRVIRKAYLKDESYINLEKRQEPWDFFIPEADEIEDCRKNGYPSRERHYGDIRTFLTKRCGIDEQKAKSCLTKIWMWTTQGYEIQDIEKELKDQGLVLAGKRDWKEFVSLMETAQRYTRCLRYRGNIPEKSVFK